MGAWADDDFGGMDDEFARKAVGSSRAIEPATYRASAFAYLLRVFGLLWGGIAATLVIVDGLLLFGFFLIAPLKMLAGLQDLAAANGLPGPVGVVGMIAFGLGTGTILLLASWLAIHHALTMPTRITIDETGRIAFRGWRRTAEFRPDEIHSIKRGVSFNPQYAYAVVRLSRGKIYFQPQLRTFRDFLARLKTLNPAVEIRGF